LALLREPGVTIVAEPFILPAINRKLAFFADPFGNLIELAEVID
jgi:glyoxylase I family protein